MKKYLLPENGQFFKANLHCHSSVSDGKLSPEEIKRIYKEKGYDDMLRAGKRIYCIATDDNHNSRNDSFGAYTMIKADKLEYKSIAQELLKGNFYSSQGPEIYELWVEENKICIKCSDVRRIVLNTDSRHVADVTADNGECVNYAEFGIMPDDIYVRITLTDYEGKHANTNAYFIDTFVEAII